MKDLEAYLEILKKHSKSLNLMLSKNIHSLNNNITVFSGQASILKLLQSKNMLNEKKVDEVVKRIENTCFEMTKTTQEIRRFYYLTNNTDNTTAFDLVEIISRYFSKELKELEIGLETNLLCDWELKLCGHDAFKLMEMLVQISLIFAKANNKLEIMAQENLITLKTDFPADCENSQMILYKEFCEHICTKSALTFEIKDLSPLEIQIQSV